MRRSHLTWRYRWQQSSARRLANGTPSAVSGPAREGDGRSEPFCVSRKRAERLWNRASRRHAGRGPRAWITPLAALLVLSVVGSPSWARPWRASRNSPDTRYLTSADKAYRFLDQMMDKYASGSRLRLVQSYEGGYLGRLHFTDSFTYDDALIVDALLARGRSSDVGRAKVLGNSLLYVQRHDPAGDGRIRAAYAPTPLASPAQVRATDRTTDVGNMAWVGQALVQLYLRTGRRAYLAGAVRIGDWVQEHAYDTRGAGGYTGGEFASGSRIMWKSTEHNIDLVGLFSLLAAATGDPVWTARSAHARHFVTAMWNPAQKFFYVGTGTNGTTINKGFLAEDVNTWSYLALKSATYSASIEWDVRHLAVSADGFSGVSFCAGDRSGVWFEGTSHLADALELRGGRDASRQAAGYLADVAHAQASGPNTNGLGIIAASKNGLSDCDGDRYYASLHTGATSWYLLALHHADPFFALK